MRNRIILFIKFTIIVIILFYILKNIYYNIENFESDPTITLYTDPNNSIDYNSKNTENIIKAYNMTGTQHTVDLVFNNNSAYSELTSTTPQNTSTSTNSIEKPIIGFNGDISYSNKDDKPWNHHPVIGSLKVNTHIFKNTKAYYYEFDDKIYNNLLRKTFSLDLTETMPEVIDYSKWSDWILATTLDNKTDNQSNNILSSYNNSLTFIQNTINNDLNFTLPGDAAVNDTSPPIQIVHDIFLRYKTHNTDPLKFILGIELILYRENKYHGKHIQTVVYNNNNIINVVAIGIIGNVPEDMIALYPIEPSNPLAIKQLTTDSLGSFPIILNGRWNGVIFQEDKKVIEDVYNHFNKYYEVSNENKQIIANIYSLLGTNNALKTFVDNQLNSRTISNTTIGNIDWNNIDYNL